MPPPAHVGYAGIVRNDENIGMIDQTVQATPGGQPFLRFCCCCSGYPLQKHSLFSSSGTSLCCCHLNMYTINRCRLFRLKFNFYFEDETSRGESPGIHDTFGVQPQPLIISRTYEESRYKCQVSSHLQLTETHFDDQARQVNKGYLRIRHAGAAYVGYCVSDIPT